MLRNVTGKFLPEFIIGRQNLSNIGYTNVSVWMTEIERKLQKIIEKVVKESGKKVLTIN